MNDHDVKAAAAYNAERIARGMITPLHVTELVAQYQEAHKLTVDGKAGAGQTIPSIDTDIANRRKPVGPPPRPAHRVLPLRRLPDGRAPIVTSAHGSVNAERRNHPGADLLYAYRPSDPPMPIGDSGRTKGYWIPHDTYACAQADGEVVICGPSRTGFRLWIRHEHGWQTGYFHFDRLADHGARTLRVGDTVTRGDDLGRVGDNPIDHDPDHLHAELYLGDLGRYEARLTLDPEIFWAGAETLPAR